MSRRRRTLAAPVEVAGVGVHTGAAATVRLTPSSFGEGLTWSRDDGPHHPVNLDHARAVPGATELVGPDGSTVSTPEHVLAALTGLGVSDTHISVRGPELPVLDGAAAAWVRAIRGAGLAEGPTRVARSVEPLDLSAHGGRVVVTPGEPVRVVHVDFGPGGPRGTAQWTDGEPFDEVAWARTFVLAHQVEALQAMGRGRGATAQNTLVWGDQPVARPDEPVVHKLLDLVGDLALVGPLAARVEVWRGSHQLHHAAMRALRYRQPG